MELDPETLDGHWSTNNKTGMDFFIINDAIFSKLCILGDDVEPCFEGSRITAPEVSTSFTKIDDGFKKTLYTMMQDLKFALEGGQKMIIDEAETKVAEFEVTEEETSIESESIEETTTEENAVEEETSEEKVNEDQSVLAENDNSIEAQSSQETFTKAKDKDKEEESKDADDSKEDSESEEDDKEKKDKEYKCGGGSGSSKEDKKKKSYSLLETELAETKAAYADLEVKYQALVDFKNKIDNEKKDALIDSFYMLSDEDKADVIENKSKYSLDDIESKLSVICVRKKVNFDLEDTSKKEVENSVVTYNISNTETSSTPAWIAALKNTRDSRK